MTYQDLFTLDFSGKTVVIIGFPASGKTTLANTLSAFTGTKLVRTDDYIPHGAVNSLYVMLDDLVEMNCPVIVEGVGGYRLLRKGVQLANFFPDVVIELEVTPEQIARVYAAERQDRKTKSLTGFCKGHQTVLAEYRAMENPKPPIWYTVKNDQF